MEDFSDERIFTFMIREFQKYTSRVRKNNETVIKVFVHGEIDKKLVNQWMMWYIKTEAWRANFSSYIFECIILLEWRRLY